MHEEMNLLILIIVARIDMLGFMLFRDGFEVGLTAVLAQGVLIDLCFDSIFPVALSIVCVFLEAFEV